MGDAILGPPAGPFSISVTLIFCSFWSGMLLLGGAYLSAAAHADRMEALGEIAAEA